MLVHSAILWLPHTSDSASQKPGPIPPLTLLLSLRGAFSHFQPQAKSPKPTLLTHHHNNNNTARSSAPTSVFLDLFLPETASVWPSTLAACPFRRVARGGACFPADSSFFRTAIHEVSVFELIKYDSEPHPPTISLPTNTRSAGPCVVLSTCRCFRQKSRMSWASLSRACSRPTTMFAPKRRRSWPTTGPTRVLKSC